MPKVKKYLRILIEICWLGIVFLIPVVLSFKQNFYNLFGAPKVFVFVLLTEIMVMLFLLLILIKNKLSVRLDNKTLLFIGLIIAGIFLSLIFSIHPLRSWQGEYMRHGSVFLLLHYWLFFFLLLLSLRNSGQIKRIIIATILSSLPVCVYGLAQFSGWDFINWKYSAINEGRIFSSLGQPNFLGHWLIMIIPITVYSLFFVFKKFLARFFVVIILLAQIICLSLSFSRAAWLGFLFQLFLLAVFFLYFFRLEIKKIFGKKKIFISFLALLFLLAVLIFGLFSNEDSRLANRAKNIFNLKYGSSAQRIMIWQSGVEEIKEMPFLRLAFGYGQENIRYIYFRRYVPENGLHEQINSYADRAHNSILDIILAQGFFGLLVLFLFWLYIIFSGLKTIKNKESKAEDKWFISALIIIFAGYFVNNLFSFSNIDTYAYLFLFLAIFVFLVNKKKPAKYLSLSFFSFYSKILIFTVFVFFISTVLWLYNIKPLVANYYLMQADKVKKGGGSCHELLKEINQAIKWNPSNHYYQEQYIYNIIICFNQSSDREDIKEIKNNIELIINLSEKENSNRIKKAIIARAYSVMGYYADESYYELAEEQFRALYELNPNFTTIYTDWGRMKLWQKEYDRAIEIFRQGLEKVPNLDDYSNVQHKKKAEDVLVLFYYYLGLAHYYISDYDEALACFKKALGLNPYYLGIYKVMGDIYYQQGEINLALWYNKRVVQLSPVDFQALFNIAKLYTEMENVEQAIKYADWAMVVNPNNKEIKEFREEFVLQK